MADSTKLKSLSDPKLPLTLHYPDPTPLGVPVSANVKSNEIGYRVHLISDGSAEIYFEVGKYPALSLDQAIDMFKQGVTKSYEDLEMGEMVATTLDSYPAQQLKIRWPGKERVITFVEKEDIVYRVIYDPHSPINHQILETFRFDISV